MSAPARERAAAYYWAVPCEENLAQSLKQAKSALVKDEVMDDGLRLRLSLQVRWDIDHERLVILRFVHPPIVGFQ